MHKKKLTWWVSSLLALMLITLTGCQTVQGLDIGGVIKNDWSVKSSESKGTLQLEFLPGDISKLSADEQKALSALQNVKIELTNVKTEDAAHVSADGSLTYSKGKIPFKLATEGTKIALSIEGAKKPVVFDLLGGSSVSFLQLLPKALQEQFGGKIAEIKPAIIGLILANTANPTRVSVTSVTDKVNGEDLALQKAHIELSGTELAALLQKLLANILADEAGLKDLINQLYDALSPVIQEQITNGSADFTLKLLGNKQLAAGLVYPSVHDFLQKASDSLNAAIAGDASADQISLPIQALFNAKSALQADIYADADKQVRKQALALNLPLANTPGVSGLKLSYVSETWNINKPTKAATIDISSGAVKVNPEASAIYSFLNNLDKQSLLYTLLKNDLKITKKQVSLATTGPVTDTPQPFINADGVTMVPVRFISEKLGAEVGWSGELQQVTIKDLLSGATIVLKLDSKTASVNGSSLNLESAATLHNSSTFVPIRFIAEQLGGVVSFNDDTRVVTIKRD
ncbi:copper amine oxidase N-terminal domain-containing protein [Paenibacillus sp. HWE-109]|uniref:copper amine oxidase N-terminal domain-containing protein n=1 Tax=Paenibacillus sp. HWE-109 TaxID=1306526 RepID=UPI001EE04375|nr:copper amine oxidase N-terminal domain-containing protein [Paenibacillus sp. HWE-109]UKS26399.1 copper amine oxidase N-terminal domain-containing protein [Paenibacillus sp. HWE-109]